MKKPRERSDDRLSPPEKSSDAKTNLHAREQSLIVREDALQSRERALAAKEQSMHARETLAQTVADLERLMDQMRQANERLAVAAVRAQYASDGAWSDAAQARMDLEDLVQQLQHANERLVEASSQTQTLEVQVRQREEDYQQLSTRLLRVQDEERRRLAADLHDSTAQRLAALTMNLDLLDRADLPGVDPQLRRALSESRLLAQSCSREVRTLAYLLHPPLLEERGLLSAVRWYVEGFMERSGIRVDLELNEIARLSPDVEAAIFRVVQESLTNVHRHASSSTALIQLTSAAQAVILEIHDRGHGFRHDLKEWNGLAPGMLGVGIQGMEERIRQLGGTFDIEFTSTGTTVRVTVPETHI